MKEEIKEILNIFKELTEDYSATSLLDFEEYEIPCIQLKMVLDYITNLQQENEDLKNRLENAVADCNLRLQENEDFKTIIKQYVDIVLHDRKIIDNYKSRIDKAIEYIENNKKETSSHFNGKEYIYRNFTLCCEPNDLLNILNGSDEE